MKVQDLMTTLIVVGSHGRGQQGDSFLVPSRSPWRRTHPAPWRSPGEIEGYVIIA